MPGGGYRGTQGKKPKASTIVERERKKREESGEGEPATQRLPAAPRHLNKGAKAEWRRLGKQLMEAGLLTDLDRNALAMYCIAYARSVQAEEMLDGPMGCCTSCDPRCDGDKPESCTRPFHRGLQYGRVVVGSLGRMVRSPFTAEAKEAKAEMVRLMGEFGLTPASRSRLPGRKGETQKPRPQRAPIMETTNDPRKLLQMQTMAGNN